jgi:transcriptional regulator with XRE-family HTH domain
LHHGLPGVMGGVRLAYGFAVGDLQGVDPMTAGEARGTAPRAPKKPNRVLRGIREARHESRTEFAGAMARVAREMGEEVYPDAKYVERLESGAISWPRPPYRNILTKLCGRPIGELGFTVPILSVSDSGETSLGLNKPLRDAIFASGMEVTQFARKVGVDPKSVQRWINKGRVPHASHRWKACQVLECEESELWPETRTAPETSPVRHPPEIIKQPEWPERMPITGMAYVNDGDVGDMERRELLKIFGGVIAVANLPGLLENELNRMHIALSRGSASDERIAYLEQLADDLGILVASAAPMAALQPALAALASVRALLEERQPTRSQVRLVTVSAKLSLIIGVEAFQLGQVKQAHEWHKAAQYAASDAGTQYFADIALAQQAFVPLYSGKPTEVVRLITPRLDSNPSPSPAVSQLWGIKARAHAVLGEKDSFRRSIGNGQDCLDHSEPGRIGPGILSFHPANLAFYETTGAVSLNDLGNSLDAATRALALFAATESYDRALVGLERACALAKGDEITEACHVAKSVILDPGTYYCKPVREYARKFSGEIRSVSSSEAREWRETLAAIDKAHGPELRE